MKNLALFDFDGTITTKDSLAEFIKFAVGSANYYLGLMILSPILVKYVLKIMPNDVAKQKMMTYFFADWSLDKFNQIANNYSQTQITKILRPKAIERIKWHQQQDDRVILVSASMENWLQQWCETMQIELIATKLEVIDNKITGKFVGKNCHGQEKVNRINKHLNLKDYNKIYAYGDSSGDKPMLAMSDKPFYKYF